MNTQTKAKIEKNLKTIPHVNMDSYFPKHQSSEKTAINLWPWLIVLCLLLMTVFILKLGNDNVESPSIDNNHDYILKAQQASQVVDDFYLPPPSVVQNVTAPNKTIENPNPMLKTQPLTLANDQLVKAGDDSVFLNDGEAEEENNDSAEN